MEVAQQAGPPVLSDTELIGNDASNWKKPNVVEVFHRVKAVLKKEILQSLTGNITDHLRRLSDDTGVDVVTDEDDCCELNGSWDQMVSCYNLLHQLAAPHASFKTLIGSAEKQDKCVTCDILKSERLSRFAMDHPRQARFGSRQFQRPRSPVRRIKDKYRTKGRNARSKRLINNLYLEKFTDSLHKKMPLVASSTMCKEMGNGEISSDVIDKNDSRDDFDSENIEPLRHKSAVSGGRSKPKKNYEELTPFKFFCKMCSFKTKRESHYQKHMNIHEKVTTLYKCDQCAFTSIRLSHLRRHEMTHSQTTFPCIQCSYKTDEMKLLIRHMKLKHERDEELLPKDILSCPDCSYQTTKQYHYQRHLRVHKGFMKGLSQLFQCDQCSYKTSRKEHFIRHVNNVHSNKRPYLCDFCGKAFKRTDALKQHRVTHANLDSKDVQFRCPVCEKSCRSHAHLLEHQAVHSNVRSFLCEICGASFKTRSVQRKHVLTIHKNPRSYPCDHCLKRFNTNYALRRHLRLHEPGAELCGRVSPPLSPSAHPEQSPEKAMMEGGSTESVLLFPTSAAALATDQLQPSGDNPLSATGSIPFTIHPAVGGGQTTIQLAASVLQASEALTAATNTSTLISVQEPIENVLTEDARQMPQTFIQASEATTALLYLTTNFTPF